MSSEFRLDTDGLRVVQQVAPFPVGPSTVAELWDRRDPASIAVVDAARQWTTAELRAECDRVARCLSQLGVRGERVVWVLGHDVASVVSLIATIEAGGVWVGVSARSTDAERQRIINDAGAHFVLDHLPEGDPVESIGSPLSVGAPVALAYTSGTTGAPKAVAHLHQQLLYPAAAAIATEGLDTSSRVGTPLPLSTLNILLLGPLTALACGGTAVLMDRSDADGFVEQVQTHRVTRALIVPTIVHDLVERGTRPGELASLDRMIMGGAGFDRSRAAAAQAALGVPLVASYGLSEAPTGVARMPIGEAGASPLPGIDIAVEDDGEITLAPATDGPWANTWQGALGYRGRPADTEGLWRGGRLHTGDAGAIDDEGRLLVTGRISDMINRGGATIAPAEVEAALLELEGVDDAAVFAVPDERLGQAVAAAVVGLVDPEAMATALRERLSGYKIPAHWLQLDELPRNANGKVERNVLRERLA